MNAVADLIAYRRARRPIANVPLECDGDVAAMIAGMGAALVARRVQFERDAIPALREAGFSAEAVAEHLASALAAARAIVGENLRRERELRIRIAFFSGVLP